MAGNDNSTPKAEVRPSSRTEPSDTVDTPKLSSIKRLKNAVNRMLGRGITVFTRTTDDIESSESTLVYERKRKVFYKLARAWSFPFIVTGIIVAFQIFSILRYDAVVDFKEIPHRLSVIGISDGTRILENALNNLPIRITEEQARLDLIQNHSMHAIERQEFGTESSCELPNNSLYFAGQDQNAAFETPVITSSSQQYGMYTGWKIVEAIVNHSRSYFQRNFYEIDLTLIDGVDHFTIQARINLSSPDQNVRA